MPAVATLTEKGDTSTLFRCTVSSSSYSVSVHLQALEEAMMVTGLHYARFTLC
jgi:hypothetical protein